MVLTEKTEAKFLVPDWGDKVSGIGLSYRPARLHRLEWWARTTTLCRSQLCPQSGTMNLATAFKRLTQSGFLHFWDFHLWVFHGQRSRRHRLNLNILFYNDVTKNTHPQTFEKQKPSRSFRKLRLERKKMDSPTYIHKFCTFLHFCAVSTLMILQHSKTFTSFVSFFPTHFLFRLVKPS